MFADARKCVFFDIEINSLGKRSSVKSWAGNGLSKAPEVGVRSLTFSVEFTPANMPWRGACEHTSIIVHLVEAPSQPT